MFTPENITQLEPDQVFVFGSNFAGRHGKGAALIALRKFGAINGQGCGPMGRSYGIATKDRALAVLPLYAIRAQVGRFLRHAAKHPEQIFLVTAVGCGLAGYSPKEIAPMFRERSANVILPERFHPFLPAP